MEFEVIAKDGKDTLVGGFGGREYKPGDIVKEIDFPKGNVKVLVEMGYLKKHVKSKKPASTK